ncbi:MAG: glycosyltransferase [Gammaproteobacteria bacterium]|nr:glycosyltransferase [Gammaproteobacteria bacterium]
MSRLLVMVPDRVSQILEKGEIQPLYYNPGQLFDEVHLLMTNDDQPDTALLQAMVGGARLVIHSHPEAPEIIAGGEWRRWWHRALRRWAEGGVEIARRIRPDLIRCHGADWNTYLASRIKRRLGTPYVVSLHINPDVNPPRRIVKSGLTEAEQEHNAFFEYIEGVGLRGADRVLPVYRPIVPYLERLNIRRYRVCYNVLNIHDLRQKTDYRLGKPPRLICVGRLIPEKNPEQILRALARLSEVRLTVVGEGPQRPALEALARELGLVERVEFRPSVPNDELCAMLPGFDMFVVHTEYWELNKSVLEGLLTGLPLVINRRIGPPVPELHGVDFVRMVDNTADAYLEAIGGLLRDDADREALGRRAYAHAQAHWSPARTEAVYVEVYRQVMAGARRH